MNAVRGVDGATRHIAGVFQTDECGLRVVINLRANGRVNLFPCHDAIVARRAPRWHATGDGRHGGQFVEVHVSAVLANHFAAVVRPDADTNEVAHAAGGDEQGGFFAEDFGSAFLNWLRWDLRHTRRRQLPPRPWRAHLLARASHGIAAKIHAARAGETSSGSTN